MRETARIGIDATAVSAQGKGHARTQRHMVEALADLGLPHELVAFVRTPEAAELLGPSGVERAVVSPRLTLQWELAGLPREVRRRRLDAVLTLSDRLPLTGAGRYAVWLFELPTHRIAQNRASGAGLYQRGSDLATLALWKRSLGRAGAVVAGSEATAAELVAAEPGLAGGVPVVHPGLAAGFGPGPGRDGRYVLHLGSDDPRDNTETVLEAFRRAALPGARLLVAGAREPLVAEGVEFLGRVSDEELVGLYRGAACFVDATLYEGFGYAVLEAMACGAPVVASRASSIPEVVGDAGLLCDPRSAAEMADAIARVLAEPELADGLRRRGLARAAEFTWERAARGLAAALEELLAR